MKKKILIVDDDPEIIKLLEFRLKQWGYDVISSEDGLDCLQIADTEKPDLVLLGIRLPGLDGISVCSELTTSHDIPVIILSGIKDEATKENVESFGAVDYITKPINMDELKSGMKKGIKQFKNHPIEQHV